MTNTSRTPRRNLMVEVLVATALVMVGGNGAAAQDLSRPMQLNRAGQWRAAAEAARALLEASAQLSQVGRCEVRSQLIYAAVRTGRNAEAADEIAIFDRECSHLSENHWARVEVERLRRQAPARPDGLIRAEDAWAVADPAELGLDTAALRRHHFLCQESGADACVVVHQGRIVQEWYAPDYRAPIMAMSSTKSVTGLLAGILIGDGKLALDDPVGRYIPEWRAGAREGVTVRQLLSMTSGLPDNRRVEDVGRVEDKEAFVFSLPLAKLPGEAWAYTNNGVFLLSPLLDRAAGEPIEQYARRRLFDPLGMGNTRLHVYPEGQAWTHADMETTPRDLARIGQLMLQGGRWEGQQIVPEAWVRISVQPSQTLNPDYGLLWWLDVPGGYAARGHLDTNLYVMPDDDLVVVRMQSTPATEAVPYEPKAFQLFNSMVSP